MSERIPFEPEHVQPALDAMVGATVQDVSNFKGHGNDIAVRMGEVLSTKVVRVDEREVAVPRHEFTVYVTSSWRLDEGGTNVSASRDDDYRAARILVGRKLESYAFAHGLLDLDLNFSDNASLRIFCDASNRDELNAGYGLRTPDRYVHVGGREASTQITTSDD